MAGDLEFFTDEKSNDDQYNKKPVGKKSVMSVNKNTFGNLFTKKTLRKRLPVLSWMADYDSSFLVSDMVAGLTVGLTAIPQGIAYAVVAGLEPQYGLYSGFVGCFMYFLLGSVKDVTLGPTAIMALMSQKSVENYNSDFAVLLCFLSGCIVLLLGVLHLGFLVSFISVPVTVGFTLAAAVTIASSQLKGLLGIEGKSNEFLEAWISVFEHIKETRYQDLCLGLITIAFLVAAKAANDVVSRKYKRQANPTKSLKLKAICWRTIALGRNAIAVILGTLAAYIFQLHGMKPFRLTGKVTDGLPTFDLPPFSTSVKKDNVTKVIEFEEMVSILGTSVISVTLISVLETIAIGKAFAKGKTLDATQEMIALGASNVGGSFFRSMPTAGSFTRTAVNNASGVKTPLGNVFTGVLVLLALTLSATFEYIPKATLAAVIMTAMFYMIEFHEIMLIWRIRKLDIIPFAATVLGALFLGLDYGILIGISSNIVFLLYNTVRPKISYEEPMTLNHEILMLRPEEAVSYPGAEYLKDFIVKVSKMKNKALVVIDGRNLLSIDSTTAKNLKTLATNLKESNQDFILWNWTSLSMEKCLKVDANLQKYFYSSDTLEELLEARSSGGNALPRSGDSVQL